eukprot:9482965-Pyramimonas_sp.AAC.1
MGSIGMMSGLYRAWARVRQSAEREWERNHRRPFLAHQAGHSILELVRKQSLDCERCSKRNEQLHSAMVLYDLSNYYEHINRSKLATRALRSGSPATLPRITMGIYASPRYVGLQVLVMCVGRTVHGIAAGCGFGTYLIQMHTIDSLDSWTQQNPLCRPLHAHRRYPFKES